MENKNTDEKQKIQFSELGLSAQVLSAIQKKGFEEPTEIQATIIPAMLKSRKNMVAQAQTGTGKTAAFGLPLIEKLKTNSQHIQALVLVPTRELALQVAQEINSLKGDRNILIEPIYGGQSIDQQLRRLKKRLDIVIGTPGRIIDHLKRKSLKLNQIDYLVFDEADEMLSMGFLEDIETILSTTNPEKQTLLFSATLPSRIKKIIKQYMGDCDYFEVKKNPFTASLTNQIYFEVRMNDKIDALCRIIDIEKNFFAMVFCRTKMDVDNLTHHLSEKGYDVGSIHGDISQAQREKTLGRFRAKKVNILIATDVAARGIDIGNLTHVINYSLPQDPESYVHRIGRTGRAGKQGTAITFITPSEYSKLMFIERITQSSIKRSSVPTVKDIINEKQKKVDYDIEQILERPTNEFFEKWATELSKDFDPHKLVSSILQYSFEDELNPENYKPIQEVSGKSSNRRGGGNSGGGGHHGGGRIDLEGKARLFVAMGKKDNINVKSLVEMVQQKVTIKSQQIRDVQVLDSFSFISVPFEKAEEIVQKFKQNRRKPLISLAKNTK